MAEESVYRMGAGGRREASYEAHEVEVGVRLADYAAALQFYDRGDEEEGGSALPA